MSDDAVLRLLSAAEYGGRQWIEALELAGSADALLGQSDAALTKLGLKRAERKRILEPPDIPPRWRRWLHDDGHTLIAYRADAYPERLTKIPDPPLALWLRGGVQCLSEPQLAIVGSRNPTYGGIEIASGFAGGLADLGLTITSGLAIGIDAASHRGALAHGGTTIAVLGHGIDRIYPVAHRSLADDIAANGAVVSEYAPG
ncbi:MAG: DNA-processing protein DprA, partial [Gammaproteobacteria bacterium]|nr:DNA-processing protein DprA [Gammaproteobacteria bacterium]